MDTRLSGVQAKLSTGEGRHVDNYGDSLHQRKYIQDNRDEAARLAQMDEAMPPDRVVRN